jgi:hypothetical protein
MMLSKEGSRLYAFILLRDGPKYQPAEEVLKNILKIYAPQSVL